MKLIYSGIFTEGYMVTLKVVSFTYPAIHNFDHQEVVRVSQPLLTRTHDEQRNRARWKALNRAKRRFPGCLVSLAWE